MTQPELHFEPLTFRDAVADLFRSRPGAWIDGLSLAQVGGAYAWRTRTSECRQLGMTIENRQRKEGRRTVSEYRYVPGVTVTDDIAERMEERAAIMEYDGNLTRAQAETLAHQTAKESR